MTKQTNIPTQTVSVLSAPISGTVAALKAHRTRWATKLDDLDPTARTEAEAKIADYDQRIAALLGAQPVSKPAAKPARMGDRQRKRARPRNKLAA